MEERLECVVSGRVQKVMFRDFTARSARRLGVKGIVENQSDGTVHIIAEGSKDTLEKLLTIISRGPRFAKVDWIEKTWSKSQGGFSKFSIQYKSIWDRI